MPIVVRMKVLQLPPYTTIEKRGLKSHASVRSRSGHHRNIKGLPRKFTLRGVGVWPSLAYMKLTTQGQGELCISKQATGSVFSKG